MVERSPGPQILEHTMVPRPAELVFNDGLDAEVTLMQLQPLGPIQKKHSVS